MPLGPLGRIIFLVALAAGTPMLCVGGYEAVETQQFINASGRATGTVVDNSYIVTRDGDGNAGGSYYPVVEFTPDEGERVRFQDGIGSLPADYEVGASVEVLYDRAAPRDARIASWKRLWLAPTIFMAVGLLPPGVAGAWLAFERGRRGR